MKCFMRLYYVVLKENDDAVSFAAGPFGTRLEAILSDEHYGDRTTVEHEIEVDI